MSVSMATERWTSQHAWHRASAVVYDTYPPMYDWKCSRCGKSERGTRPSESECPGRGKPNTETEREA